ncbi:hypothetical protein LSH36_1193g00001 [Paralvinella palmiformis]|uniref:Uncharacterized protein n=1 Tax=Paralvinella palmiformis TaxID=53620 RepID=A0AAD9IUT5_9ANNE|nr:hypothetical protein LSH36_1193g00001 [Paralvinella palmiformis]
MEQFNSTVQNESGLAPIWDYLHQLRIDNKLCDIQLLIRTKHPLEDYVDDFAVADCIQAHKIILAASSQFFRRCLDKGELLNVYNFDGIQSKNMQVLVDYMYHQVSWHEVQANEEAAEVARILEVIEHEETMNRMDYPKDLDGNRVLIVKMHDQSNRTTKTSSKSKRVIVDNLEAEFLRHDIHSRHQRKVTGWENQMNSPLVIAQLDQSAGTSMINTETVQNMQHVAELVSDDVREASSTGNMRIIGTHESLVIKENCEIKGNDFGSSDGQTVSVDHEIKLVEHSHNDSKQGETGQTVTSTEIQDRDTEQYCDESSGDRPDGNILRKSVDHQVAMQPSTVILIRKPDVNERNFQTLENSVKNEMFNLESPACQPTSDGNTPIGVHGDTHVSSSINEPLVISPVPDPHYVPLARTVTSGSDTRRYSTRFMGQKRVIEVLPRKVRRRKLEDGRRDELTEPAVSNIESSKHGRDVNIINPSLKVIKLEKVSEDEKLCSEKLPANNSQTISAVSALPSMSERELHLTWNHGLNQSQQQPSNRTGDGSLSEVCLIHKSEAVSDENNQDDVSCVRSTAALPPCRRGRPRKQRVKTLNDSAQLTGSTQVGSLFQCRFCGKSFKNCTGLSIHEQWKHGAADAVGNKKEISQKTYTCDSCNKVCGCFQALVQHMRCIHNKTPTHKCKECNIEFNTKRAYNAHMVREHNTSLYTCKLCKTTFKSPEGYKIHMFKKHTEAENAFECSKCGKTFKMKHELAIHLKITHADQRAYKCQLCTRAFKGKAALKRHLQTYHTNIRKIHCPVCSMLFKTNADMMSHQRKHFRTSHPKQRIEAVADEHQCSRCDKIFPKLMALVNHERQVHHVRGVGVTYMCTMCEKSYSTKNYLLNHIRQMHLPRRYKCHQCLYEFPYSYMLKKHLPKCKGYPIISKPYRCSRCNRYFNLKGNLTRHMRTIGRCHRAVRNYADYIVMVKSVDDDASSAEHITHEQKVGQDEVTPEALQASEALQQLQTSGSLQQIDQDLNQTNIQELVPNNVQFTDGCKVLDQEYGKIKQEENLEEENIEDSLQAFEQLKDLISLPKGLHAMNIKKDADGNVIIEVAGQVLTDNINETEVVVENQETPRSADMNEMNIDQQLVHTSDGEIILQTMPAFHETGTAVASESQLQSGDVSGSQYSLHQDLYQIGPDGTLQQLVHSDVIQGDDIQIIHDAGIQMIEEGEALEIIHSEDGEVDVVEAGEYSQAPGDNVAKNKNEKNV